ncbi:MAG: PTS sugar transporter subunit IIA [Candidatus Firestonebacteria bacterium]|nr:PTS sugar transporter subunit IIA [Candidatus Firestonebacteria bacterium]
MKSLLNALQEGRLIELPVTDKGKCLEYLALLIEAVPDIGTDMDLVQAVKEREAAVNTGIGKGVACPHIRGKLEGDLLCAVGWSPEGVDYGSTDGEKVHLIVMYYIPDAQKNAYLKEVSGLAQALSSTDEIKALTQIGDIQSLRSKLLDWVELSLNHTSPGAVARMIKLEEKSATLAEIQAGKKIQALGFSLVKTADNRVLVLSQDLHLIETLEKAQADLLSLHADEDKIIADYHLVVLSSKSYILGRSLLECVALKRP